MAHITRNYNKEYRKYYTSIPIEHHNMYNCRGVAKRTLSWKSEN